MILKCACKQLIRIGVVVLAAVANDGLADTTNLNPVADTSLFEYAPTNNMGALVDLPMGTIDKGSRSRLLLRFDPAAALPPGATVTAATLTMQVVSAKDSGAVNSNFQLYRMLVPWVEGTKKKQQGQLASDGETTWNARLAPNVLWSQPGAAAPVDFSPVISGTKMFLGTGSYTFASDSNLVADVQFWIQNPQSNFGWIVLCDKEALHASARRVDSRENHVHPPTLTVEFTAPQLPQIDSINRVQGRVQILFSMLANQVYEVQYSSSLSTQTWSALTQLGPNAFATNAMVEDSISNGPFRCYRIGTTP